ncbi:MAG: hypothetical protein ACYDDF_03135 [Thermoplasmatota archaeon]
MPWTVALLPGAQADVTQLAGSDAKLRSIIEGGILEEFEGFKAQRLSKLFVQGVSTASVDKLSGSQFPGSIRIQVRADYRATVLCFPAYEQAFVTHVFHKSADPQYKTATSTHNRRAGEYIESFTAFVSKRRK